MNDSKRIKLLELIQNVENHIGYNDYSRNSIPKKISQNTIFLSILEIRHMLEEVSNKHKEYRNFSSLLGLKVNLFCIDYDSVNNISFEKIYGDVLLPLRSKLNSDNQSQKE